MRSTYVLAVLLAVLLGTWGCGPPGPSTTVQRIDPKAQTDLSGAWNDTDANKVAQAMIADCLTFPWASKFKAEKGRDPVVRLRVIRNRSHEHINTRFFTEQFESELLRSGVAKVVSDKDEAEENRDERDDQARNASDKTAKQHQQETGSDFILIGEINAVVDAVEGQRTVAYVTSMKLSDSESNIKVWSKVHPIKKVVNQAGAQW